MLPVMFALMVAGVPPGATPGVSISVTEPTAGVCSLGSMTTAAQVHVGWASGTFDPTDYLYKLYENDAVIYSGTGAEYLKDIDAVRDATWSRTTVSWTYRIDVVRRFDNAVVATASSTWNATYGQCSKGAGE